MWELFYQNFEGFLPLRNVGIGVTKASSLPASPRTQYNSFPSVSVHFEPYSADVFAAKDLFSMHNRPLVHLFLAACEVRLRTELLKFISSRTLTFIELK